MAGGGIERFGPGRILMRRSMEHLCRQGIKEFDFGVGEDPCKTHWCEQTVDRYDVLVWFSLKGWAFNSALKLFLTTKAMIKQSPVLFRLFSSCRRKFGYRISRLSQWAACTATGIGKLLAK